MDYKVHNGVAHNIGANNSGGHTTTARVMHVEDGISFINIELQHHKVHRNYGAVGGDWNDYPNQLPGILSLGGMDKLITNGTLEWLGAPIP